MTLSKKILITAATAVLVPSLTFAGLFGGDDTSQATALINKVTNNKATIVKKFDAIANLEGFVLKPTSGPGQKTILYADKAGQYVIAGAVINAQGQNIVEQDTNKYINAAEAPKAYSQAASTHYLLQGDPNAPHKMYIMAEPNCSACHLLYKEVEPMIKAKKLAVRWIFVAFLRPESQGQVAAVFQAKDPLLAFQTDEKNFKMSTEQGSLKPAKTITADSKKYIQQNMNYMLKNGFVVTPIVIFKDNAGKPQVLRGFTPGPQLVKTLMTASNQF